MGKLVYNPFTNTFEKIKIAYPKHYIKQSDRLQLEAYEQYNVRQGKIKIAGVLRIGDGGMIIIR